MIRPRIRRRHLVYFVCPLVAGNRVWRTNIRRVAAAGSQFCSVHLAIATEASENLEPPGVVLAECRRYGLCPDSVNLAPNVAAAAESPATKPVLQRLSRELSDDAESAIFFAHAKGVSYSSQGTIELWRNNMYDDLLSDWSRISGLLRRHSFVGSYDDRHTWLVGNEVWGAFHFPGTFWWVRADALRDQGRVEFALSSSPPRHMLEAFPGRMSWWSDAAVVSDLPWRPFGAVYDNMIFPRHRCVYDTEIADWELSRPPGELPKE